MKLSRAQQNAQISKDKFLGLFRPLAEIKKGTIYIVDMDSDNLDPYEADKDMIYEIISNDCIYFMWRQRKKLSRIDIHSCFRNGDLTTGKVAMILIYT